MLDIIIKTLGELFEDPTERPQPRRRPARPGGDGEMGDPSQAGGPATLEDFMRQVLGGETPERQPEPEPQAPPPPPKPARQPKAARRERKAERQTSPRPMAEPAATGESFLDGIAADVAGKRVESGQTRPAEAIAATLRDNPQAAREAFIYAEIFGRPLGDR